MPQEKLLFATVKDTALPGGGVELVAGGDEGRAHRDVVVDVEPDEVREVGAVDDGREMYHPSIGETVRPLPVRIVLPQHPHKTRESFEEFDVGQEELARCVELRRFQTNDAACLLVDGQAVASTPGLGKRGPACLVR